MSEVMIYCAKEFPGAYSDAKISYRSENYLKSKQKPLGYRVVFECSTQSFYVSWEWPVPELQHPFPNIQEQPVYWS